METRIAAPFPPRASYSSARQRACSSQPMIFLSDPLLDYSRPTMISVISRPSSPVCGCSGLSADWPICRLVSLLRRCRHIRPQHLLTGTNDAPRLCLRTESVASRGRFWCSSEVCTNERLPDLLPMMAGRKMLVLIAISCLGYSLPTPTPAGKQVFSVF